MKILVFIDDRPASYSAFYKAMEIVRPDDWIILVAKAHYGRGIGHDSSESMRFFGRILDKRKIKSLHFLEYGTTKDILKSKVIQFRIDMALITPYNSKTKKLQDYLSQSLKVNTLSVKEYLPADESLIPRPIDKTLPIPADVHRKMTISESCSAIPLNTPSYTNKEIDQMSTRQQQQHDKPHGIPLMASKSEYNISEPERYASTKINKSDGSVPHLPHSASEPPPPQTSTITPIVITSTSHHPQVSQQHPPGAIHRHPLQSSMQNLKMIDENEPLKSSGSYITRQDRPLSRSSSGLDIDPQAQQPYNYRMSMPILHSYHSTSDIPQQERAKKGVKFASNVQETIIS